MTSQRAPRQNYRDNLRLRVLPTFEHYTLGEITTGRVEWFLKAERQLSVSWAKQSRTLLNLMFSFALRHDAITRSPVHGTSPLPRQKGAPHALTLDQIAAIRHAAATWRTDPKARGPKNDGQVRDIIEVLLGTAMRTGEVLALRPCDITDGANGMVAHVNGTVVQRKGAGTVRQDRPKTDASIRHLPVPAFAAEGLWRRLTALGNGDRHRTIFANRAGGPLSPYNARRTFRDFLKLGRARRTRDKPALVPPDRSNSYRSRNGQRRCRELPRHTSTAITEGHYIEPDRTIDLTPASHLERTLRPNLPDGALLAMPPAQGEEQIRPWQTTIRMREQWPSDISADDDPKFRRAAGPRSRCSLLIKALHSAQIRLLGIGDSGARIPPLRSSYARPHRSVSGPQGGPLR